jgi:hypothetical protein
MCLNLIKIYHFGQCIKSALKPQNIPSVACSVLHVMALAILVVAVL